MGKTAVSPEQFTSFGELLKYLRRREGLTQRELAIQVGYSDTQISRIEQNQRVPDEAMLKAQFVPALHLGQEGDWVARLLELAREAHTSDLTETEINEKSATPNNLPSLLTTFIGRENEQTEIEQLIGTHRLVTLTGSGGVGKTRLSLKVGGEILEQFPNGVWFVELAPLSDPELLEQTVASVFGIAPQASTIPITQLLNNFLCAKSALLILDNCEHLLDACAQFSDTLLRNCPNLKILATSRQPLGILGEIQYRMPSLGLPDAQQSLEKFRDYESVRLFEERAKLAQPDFELTMEDIPTVSQICSRLDGIPLAIELAAAHINVFSTTQIAERLVNSFDLLTGGSRTALPHQQTIRASIDWSWNLLSESEKTLLRRLTIFSGGWTMDAAESVCSTTEIDPQSVPELMTQLVAKSLVMVNRQRGHERRFHLHTTINQFAYEKLIKSDELDSVRDRHLKYFLGVSELAERALRGPQQITWLDRLTDERDNLRVALEHADSTSLEDGLFLSGRLGYYWIVFDVREGLRWTTEFVQIPESRNFPEARAKALLTMGNMLWTMQQFEAASSIAGECLDLFRICNDQQGEFETLMFMGVVNQFMKGMEQKIEFQRQALALARSMGDIRNEGQALAALGWDQRDPQLGLRLWKEGVALLRQAGDWRNLAHTLGIMGFTVLSNGDLEAAQKSLDEAHEINQQINNKEMEFVLTGKGILALQRGDYEQARAFLLENAEHLEEVGNRMGALWARARIAYVTLCEGNVKLAQQLLTEVIENFYADHNKSGVAYTLDKLASLYVMTDKPEIAAQLIGWSDATRKEIGDPRPRIDQAESERDITAIKTKIGSAMFEDAYHAGQEMTLDSIVAVAIS